ncbi:insulinase family protein [Christiangramia sp.]|uniref:M16 family metallopeptidase n=1 Tax=Christiangramia sp. TaxID=1931228 RepID=UPI00260987FD|nr:insulinase family protein [Christiangramia sp.]
MRINDLILIVLLFTFFNSSGQKPGYDISEESLSLDPAVRYGTLDNGFTYYLRKNDSPTKSIEFHMVVKAGTLHEDDDQLEYAHLLEHMGYKGTKHFPNLNNHLHTSGRWGSAKTNFYKTFYRAIIPSDLKNALYEGLQVLRDWTQDIRLEQSSIDVDRMAVLGEMRTTNPHARDIRQKLSRILSENAGHYLPPRDMYKKSMENYDRDAFLRFYNDWYRPDLQAAIVVGNFDVDSAEVKIKELFSDLMGPARPRNPQVIIDNHKVKLTGENRYLTMIDTIDTQFRVFLGSKFYNRSFKLKSYSDYKAMLLQNLFRKIIDVRGRSITQQYHPPLAKFNAKYGSGAIGSGQLFVTQTEITFESDKPRYIKHKIQEALVARKSLYSGITASELESAKEKILLDYNFEDMSSSRSLALKYQDHFVHGSAASAPREERAFIKELVNGISLKEMQEVMLEHSDVTENQDFIFFTDGTRDIPDAEILESWIVQVDTMKVTPFKLPGRTLIPLVDLSKESDKNAIVIKDRTEDLIGVSTIKLKNGISIVLKPTTPRSHIFNNSVAIQAFKSTKIPLKKRSEYLAAEVAPDVVQFSGAGEYNKFEIERYMQDNGLAINFEITKDFQIINASSKVENLENLLSLLYLYLEKPRKDVQAFEIWKEKELEYFKGNVARGSSEFYYEEINQTWYPELPKMTAADIKKLKLENVFTAYDNCFADFTGSTFIITGDFNKEKIESTLVKYLSALPAKKKRSKKGQDRSQFPLNKMEQTIKLKNLNQAFIHLYLPVKVSTDIKTRAELEVLSKALNQRIRRKLRIGSYSPRATGDWIDFREGIYAFQIIFDSDLGNEKNMIRYALKEFQELKQNGVDRDWLKTALKDEKAAFGSRLGSFGYFNFWPDYLKHSIYVGEDPQEMVLKYGAMLEHFISLEDIDAAAGKYLTKENLQKFLIVPKDYHRNMLK